MRRLELRFNGPVPARVLEAHSAKGAVRAELNRARATRRHLERLLRAWLKCYRRRGVRRLADISSHDRATLSFYWRQRRHFLGYERALGTVAGAHDETGTGRHAGTPDQGDRLLTRRRN